jgi:hypothetical protein
MPFSTLSGALTRTKDRTIFTAAAFWRLRQREWERMQRIPKCVLVPTTSISIVRTPEYQESALFSLSFLYLALRHKKAFIICVLGADYNHNILWCWWEYTFLAFLAIQFMVWNIQIIDIETVCTYTYKHKIHQQYHNIHAVLLLSASKINIHSLVNNIFNVTLIMFRIFANYRNMINFS